MTEAAAAQTRTVIVGRPFKLHSAYAAYPDYTSAGDPVIRVAAPPVSIEVIYASGLSRHGSFNLMVR